MKVGIVAEQYPPDTVGGMGVHCFELTEALRGLGVDVSVAAPETSLPGSGNAVRIRRFGAEYMSFLLSEELQRWGDPTIMTKYMQFNILSPNLLSDCDIIHAHDWLSVLSLGIAKDLGKKTVLTMHSIEEGRQGQGGSQIVRKIERLGGRLADHVITVSEAMKEDLVRIGYPPEKISVIYNGIDLNKYSVRPAPENDVPKILFIGRLDWVKGIDTLLHAMARLENPARLVVLGRGAWEGYAQNIVRELNLSNVEFIPKFVPEDEKINLIASSDICCFPSKYEPFGIVALEGMAMGKPIVTGDVGGFKEFVPQEQRADPQSSTELAKTLDRLLGDKNLREETGKRNREISESFSWKIIAKKTKAIYEKVLST